MLAKDGGILSLAGNQARQEGIAAARGDGGGGIGQDGDDIGPLTICYQGLPLGPAKNLGKRCNNLYPKAKRIRMDIR